MFEVKIYGEIIPFEDNMFIEKGGYVNLSSVQSQLEKANGEDLYVKLRSYGGDVETGFSIYAELRRYAKDNNAKITILGEGQLASIATVIFLAGDERILTGHTEPFVHNAWVYTEGDSKQLQRVAADLSKCNNQIAEHYALHTDLTKEEALVLMEEETSITAEEAVNIRFATSIEEVLRPVALKRFNINKNEDKMNKKTQTLLNKAMNFLKGFQNKLVATADGTELDFYELEDEAVVEVGAKATFDGADAQGDYVIPLTGETYTFEAGELTVITPAEDEMTIEEAKAEIAALTDQLEAVTNKAVDLDTENKANIALIAGFKASSKVIPKVAKVAPKKVETTEPTTASKAVANFNKFKTK